MVNTRRNAMEDNLNNDPPPPPPLTVEQLLAT
uniref:Uncharacterized protein n=1 Tax=Arundo donax TaxID=35708 RepID=A0A0A9AXI6_ARUDO